MTDIITPEVVEKGARAAEPEAWQPCGFYDAGVTCQSCDVLHKAAMDRARTCLSAALPDIVGACRRYAELQMENCEDENDLNGAKAARTIMLAIGNLSPHPVNQEKE